MKKTTHSSDQKNCSPGISRRQAIKTIGAAAGLAMAGLTFPRVAIGADQPTTAPANDAAGPVPPRVNSFALADVKLDDGPFRQAQLRTAKYLLSLEPDRLLHNFRVNAALPPKAAIYGGWESVKTWEAIRCHGHTLGHYLSACAMMYAATGNEEFKDRVSYIAGELLACQQAGKNGLICAFPEGGAVFDAAPAGKRLVGVPWYTMHKILAGLRDACLFCDSGTARQVLIALADWAVDFTSPISDQLFQRMLNVEHGGMNEVLADVHAMTGDAKYLALSERFCHRAVLDPLSRSHDILSGLHANTQIPKMIGFQKLYAQTGRANYATAASFFWRTVVTNRSFCTGGHGDNEHFFSPADFAHHAGSAKNMETCCDYNMLKLTRALFVHDPSPAYADYYELALYNGILASQDPDSGMMTYFQGTRPGYMKLYCTPEDSFWCCTGTGMENHAKYGDSIYFHDERNLYVNLFIASSVLWKEKGVTLHQTTQFPDESKTTLRVEADSPVEFTLQIRHPAWCKTMSIACGGDPAVVSPRPGSYVAVSRTWNPGDVVEINLPMELRMVTLPHAPQFAAFMHGPIVLAGALGNEGIKPGSDLIVNERTYGTALNEPFDVPQLAADALNQMKAAGDEPQTFTVPGRGDGQAIRLKPYFKIAHERYCIYWNTAEA
jgi:uncharacterized protein